MASWSGITAVTAYSPVLLKQAGYGTIKQAGLAGGLNTIGIGEYLQMPDGLYGS